MRAKSSLTVGLLLLFILIENLCLYYLFRAGVWTTDKNAICLFLASLLFGVVFLYRFYNEPLASVSSARDTRPQF